MITVHNRLTAYCEVHGTKMPFGSHPIQIGSIVAKIFKQMHEGAEPEKIMVEMEVNAYPDDFLPSLDDLIDRYFKSPLSFLEMEGKWIKEPAKPKMFNYNIREWEIPAFEQALSSLNIPIKKNEGFGNKGGMAQYIIPSAGSPANLINLGRKFNKFRVAYKRNDNAAK